MNSTVLDSCWHISPQGLNIITENNTLKNKTEILNNALKTDLKEIGSPILSKELTKSNISQVVLQIQKIRNISAPKANEKSQAAPRMLKLVLTDGSTYIQAIEISLISAISRDKTPPGSKLLIKSAEISSGYLLLNDRNCSLLGGKVPSLVEKWELVKSVQSYNRQSARPDGPPVWVNFGQKISGNEDQSFKSLENKNKESSKENTEFELQRQDAIAEATTGAIKKTFGGGVKQSIQQNTANSNFKRNYDQQRNLRDDKNKNYKGKKSFVKEVDEKPQKPSEKVSLFDFLEDKLPMNDTSTTSANNNLPQTQFLDNKKINYSNNNFYQHYRNPKSNYNNYASKKQYNENRNSNNQQTNKFESKPAPILAVNDSSKKPVYNNSNVYQPAPVDNNLNNNFGKMSLNSQFASRSLKQHLNLNTNKKYSGVDNIQINSISNWQMGDECLAKYWEDGKYYNASITAITEKTYVVKFKGYGNIEEVLKTDCLPVTSNQNNRYEPQKRNYYAGSMEFRRSAKK